MLGGLPSAPRSGFPQLKAREEENTNTLMRSESRGCEAPQSNHSYTGHVAEPRARPLRAERSNTRCHSKSLLLLLLCERQPGSLGEEKVGTSLKVDKPRGVFLAPSHTSPMSGSTEAICKNSQVLTSRDTWLYLDTCSLPTKGRGRTPCLSKRSRCLCNLVGLGKAGFLDSSLNTRS